MTSCWVCDERIHGRDDAMCVRCAAENEKHRVYDKPDHQRVLWALAELNRVVGGVALASRPAGTPEWDWVGAFPARALRRLRGARYMRRGGEQPDVLADLIGLRVAEVETIDDAMEWYVRTCLVAIDEARLLAHRRRHLRVAQRNEYPTYYAYRTALAKQLGYESVWDMRRRKKWL